MGGAVLLSNDRKTTNSMDGVKLGHVWPLWRCSRIGRRAPRPSWNAQAQSDNQGTENRGLATICRLLWCILVRFARVAR